MTDVKAKPSDIVAPGKRKQVALVHDGAFADHARAVILFDSAGDARDYFQSRANNDHIERDLDGVVILEVLSPADAEEDRFGLAERAPGALAATKKMRLEQIREAKAEAARVERERIAKAEALAKLKAATKARIAARDAKLVELAGGNDDVLAVLRSQAAAIPITPAETTTK